MAMDTVRPAVSEPPRASPATGLARRFPALAALRGLLPGVLVCVVIASSAAFLSEHYGGPRLLYALLLGLAFHFLSELPRVHSGVEFCSRSLLRVGVALLGVRITVDQVTRLGWATAAVVAIAVAMTVLLGIALSRWLGRASTEGVITGASVGICGASAAMAVSSVLPPTPENQRFTLLAVVGVTVLSTVAMVVYPFALSLAGLAAEPSGIVLGGTIHDVAQVVAAGMLLGPHAGDTATVVKLFRVMLLVPVVLLVSLAYRSQRMAARAAEDASRPVRRAPLVPGFLLAFAGLVVLSSMHVFSAQTVALASAASGWMLVVAIAAAGIKTSVKALADLGWQPVVMLVVETVWIAAVMLLGVWIFALGA
ncbi:YeiH family protein [Paracidovorax anthurii]